MHEFEKVAIKTDKKAKEKLRLLKTHYLSYVNVSYKAYKALLPDSFEAFHAWRSPKLRDRQRNYIDKRRNKAKQEILDKFGVEL